VESFYLDRPLNFAHRGASYEAPENTLAAFLLATELGADGVELDVQLTKDGELVIIHDLTLETTTDGSGLVRDKTLAELKQLDAGSRFDPSFAGAQIPTLQEVIDVVGHKLLLNIELKTSSWRDDGLAAAVVRTIEESRLWGRVVLSSFSLMAVRRVKQLNPWIPVGLLYSPDQGIPWRKAWLRRWVRPDALHPYYSIADAAYVRWAKQHGYRVHIWTVDQPGDMWQLMRRGVDMIITNRPDVLRQVLMAGAGRLRTQDQRLLPAPGL
jgi:glycerophosphoryl diester phosphodiesterase